MKKTKEREREREREGPSDDDGEWVGFIQMTSHVCTREAIATTRDSQYTVARDNHGRGDAHNLLYSLSSLLSQPMVCIPTPDYPPSITLTVTIYMFWPLPC